MPQAGNKYTGTRAITGLNMATSASPFEEVFEEELHEIRKRRVASGMWTREQDSDITDEELRAELSGVALSGGGVRSAAFNLGMVQALYSAGRLKLVDYLSTVSGGGYTGALVSSEVALDRDGVNWCENDHRNRLSIESRSKSGQPRRVYDIALYGRRMGNTLKLLSRHLAGWIITITFLLSGVVAVASLLAWLMRMPWNSGALSLLPELGFHTDIQRAFFPAFLAMLLWLLMLGLSAIGRAFGWKVPPTSRVSYLVLISTFFLGIVVLLAIDDIGFDDWIAVGNLPDSWSEGVNRVANSVGTVIAAVFAAMIAPYLMPTKLLRSGSQKSSRLQRTVFNFAGYGVLVGTPLVVFFILCTEDISGTHEARIEKGELSASNLKGFREFTGVLKLDESTPPTPPQKPRDSVERLQAAIRSVKGEDGTELYQRWNSLEDQKIANLTELSLLGRWTDFIANATVEHNRGVSAVRRRNREESRQLRGAFASAVTKQCLSDPAFFNFETRKEPENPSRADAQIVATQKEIAQAAAKIALDVKSEADKAQASPNSKSDWTILGRLTGAVVPFAELFGQTEDTAPLPESAGDVPEVTGETAKQSAPLLADLSGVLYLDGSPFKTVLSNRWLVSGVEEQEELRRQAYTLLTRADRKKEILSSFHLDEKESKNLDQLKKLFVAVFSTPPTTLNTLTDRFCDKLQEKIASLRKEDGRKTLTDGEELTLIWESLQAEREQDWTGNAESRDESAQDQYRTWLTTKEQELRRFITTTRLANWKLLTARYPRHFTSESVVYAGNVNDPDQATRLSIMWKALLIFVVVGLVSNLNTTCLHGVYRDELAAVWLRDPAILLKDLDTCSAGGPLQLINCTMNHLSSMDDPDPEQRSRFVLSNRFCGSKLTGYRATELYQSGETTVADAIAISGAAVSTSNAGNQLYRIMLLITNFRLGQWLRNPSHYQEEHYWPSPLRALISLLWNPGERPFCFLSDGGHLDNTGLASLLQRRCRFMILGDASYDPNYGFEDVRKVLQAARAKYHIEFELGGHAPNPDAPGSGGWQFLDSLRPDESGKSQKHFVVLRVRYPEKNLPDGILVVAKTGVTGDEPIDVVELKRCGDAFPHDPTSNQFLPPDQFEAYVSLGRHVGNEINQYLDEQGLPVLKGHRAHPKKDRLVDYWGRQACVLAGEALATLLRDPKFDAMSVAAGKAVFGQWLQTPHAMADDGDLEVLSAWSRSRCSEGSSELRSELSAVFIEAIENHLDRIEESETAQLELMRMLLSLAEDDPRANNALKLMSRADNAEFGAGIL